MADISEQTGSTENPNYRELKVGLLIGVAADYSGRFNGKSQLQGIERRQCKSLNRPNPLWGSTENPNYRELKVNFYRGNLGLGLGSTENPNYRELKVATKLKCLMIPLMEVQRKIPITGN